MCYDPTEKMVEKPTKIPDNYCRRMILIDGTNVVYDSKTNRVIDISMESRKDFNAAGLLLVVYTFLKEGYEVLVSLKSHFKWDQTENSFIFDELEKMEILSYVPNDESNKSLDDEVLLYYSENNYKAAVVSNDQFKDYLNQYPETIGRRIGFNFGKLELRMNQYYLDENRFNFTNLTFNINKLPFDFADPDSNVALCSPTDADYEDVKSMYQQIHPNYFPKRIHKCEMIGDFLRLKKCVASPGQPRPKLSYFNVYHFNIDSKFKDFYNECKELYDKEEF